MFYGKPDQWRLLGKTRDVSMWIDATRIDSTRADHAVAVWLRFDSAKPDPVPGHADQFFAQTQVRLAVDCRDERVRNLAMTLVLTNGSPLRMNDIDSSAAPVAFAAHPFGRGTFIAVCGWLRAPDLFRPPSLDTSIYSH